MSSHLVVCDSVGYNVYCGNIKFSSQDKHEENHQPKLHGGLVIKNNANQRYATNAVTSFIFRELAVNHNLPVQVCYMSIFF